MAKPRLLIADDHELLLEGLRRILESDFELAGTVADGRAAVEAYLRLRPDALLLDIGMPLLNGIEVARHVRRADPGARIIFVTMQTDRAYIEAAFHAGASGYVLKQAAASDLLEAIRAALRGRRFISPRISMPVSEAVTEAPADAPTEEFGSELSRRQREVLQLVSEGKAMKEIAAILGISVRTVEFHKTALRRYLGLRTTADLTRYAIAQRMTV